MAFLAPLAAMIIQMRISRTCEFAADRTGAAMSGAPEILDLVHQHGFHAVRVTMKNAHHARQPEIIITRERLFA